MLHEKQFTFKTVQLIPELIPKNDATIWNTSSINAFQIANHGYQVHKTSPTHENRLKNKSDPLLIVVCISTANVNDKGR
mgnify:CR=1 FL=1